MGNTYFAFDYLPEPTMLKFDHVGILTMEISLNTIEFQPAAQAARRAIGPAPKTKTSALHRIITAIGVDPRTQDIWLAIGTLLMHFDKDGTRLASFRTYIPGGARLEASTILVEPDRLLIGADPSGIYEFPRPDKLPQIGCFYSFSLWFNDPHGTLSSSSVRSGLICVAQSRKSSCCKIP